MNQSRNWRRRPSRRLRLAARQPIRRSSRRRAKHRSPPCRESNAAMFGLGVTEILVILIVAFLLFGPQQLPEVGRQVGKAVKGLRDVTEDVKKTIEPELNLMQAEMKSVEQDLESSMKEAEEAIKKQADDTQEGVKKA